MEPAINNSAQLDLLSNAAAAIALGDALCGLGRIDEADVAYRRALALGQETSRCFMGLGKVARARGDHEGALFQFRRADPSETASLEVATSLGDCRRIDDAMEMLCGLLARRPSFLEAAQLLARLLRQKTSPPPGLNGFLDQPFADMNSFWSRHEVALALLDIGCLNESEAIFDRSGIQFPQSTASFIGRSTIARKRADPEQALSWLQRAEVLDPDNSYVKLEIANNLRGLQRYDEARDAYRALLTHPTHRRSALIGLYYCLLWSGDDVAAGALFEDVYACACDDARLRAVKAERLRAAGQFAQSDTLYDMVLSEKPDDADALFGKGLNARGKGDREQARSYFERTLAENPRHAWASVELASEMRQAGEMDAAKATLAALLERDPSNISCRMHLAFVERAAGQRDAAIACFIRILELDPRHVSAFIERANDEAAEGRFGLAVDLLRQAEAIAPEDAHVMEAMARFEALRGDHAAALDWYRRAGVAKPDLIWVRLGQARMEMALGEIKTSFETLARIEDELGPKPEIALVKSDQQKQLGDYPAALASLRVATEAFPASFPLLIQRVLLEIELGRFADAAARLESAKPTTTLEKCQLLIARSAIALAKWRIKHARAFLQRAQSLDASNPWIYSKLILCDLLDVDFGAAERNLQRQSQLNRAEIVARGWSRNLSQTHYGQLFDEFRLDEEAASRVRSALTLETGERVDALLSAVRDYPDTTLAAIHFFIALRQNGLPVRNNFQNQQMNIPKRISQFWDSAEPPREISDFTATWRDLNPGYGYELFTEGTAAEFLKKHFPHQVVHAFVKANQPAMKADIFRLAYLYSHGGFYVDADDRCLQPLDKMDIGDAQLLLYQEDIGSLGNNFIGCEPGHPLIGRALAWAVDAAHRGDADILWLSTGPGLLSRAFATLLAEKGASWREGLAKTIIFDRHEIIEFLAIHCQVAYKHTDNHWIRSVFGSKKQQKPESNA